MTDFTEMLSVLTALDMPTWYTFTAMCPVCLKKTEYHSRQKPQNSDVSIVCNQCARTMDSPTIRTDTGIR